MQEEDPSLSGIIGSIPSKSNFVNFSLLFSRHAYDTHFTIGICSRQNLYLQFSMYAQLEPYVPRVFECD